MFAALPEPAYLTYGNVDLPQMWAGHLRPGHRVLDGERVELGGSTVCFVGGGLRSPYRTPNELDDDAYAAKVAAVSGADVLWAASTGTVPELLYDTVARRLERGSTGLLAEINRSPAPLPAARRPSTSRSPAGCGWAGPSASTWGTSGNPQPYVLAL